MRLKVGDTFEMKTAACIQKRIVRIEEDVYVWEYLHNPSGKTNEHTVAKADAFPLSRWNKIEG